MSGALRAIVWGGTACAILDGAAATVQFALMGIPPLRVWQGIASGLLGERAFHQGRFSAGLGLLLHFTIATLAAALFVEASVQLPFLARDYWIAGPLYGVVVFLVMNLVVVPLSARPKRSPSAQAIAIQLIIHILFVGSPIGLAANLFALPS